MTAPSAKGAVEPVASVKGLQHSYGKQVALRGVSIDLQPGGMVGLIGPDGVGKSTLLAIMAGAKKIQTGEVRLFGGDFKVSRHRRAVCGRIAYMPQGLGRNLYPDLSVQENMAFFSRLFGQGASERKSRTDQLVTATGLAPFRDRRAGQLSGGMRQKLGLCCALIHDPDLLILDEPTTGVDPLSRRQFWDLVDGIRAARPAMSVIVATSYMDEANRFEQLLAMNDGAILASGSPSDIKKRTGCQTLDESFIALLPKAQRDGRVRPEIAAKSFGAAKTAVSANHLTRRFGDFVAVNDVTFDIKQGEIFGFLGSNGCGKSTTMKMLTGLLPVSGGQAMLFGKPVDPNDIALRYKVGYMSQAFSLYMELTVEQNLVLHTRLYHMSPEQAKTRVEELTATFSLNEHFHALAADLPLGIRQRLALAVAVINNPQILLLDEPTSGVDPLARDQFWALLGDLSRNHNATIFISTHFMNEAALCDRILLMNCGKVLAAGPPADVVKQWGGTTLEAAFIACLEAAEVHDGPAPAAAPPKPQGTAPVASGPGPWFSPKRLLAYSQREALELWRDPIRLGFSVLGTAFLMLALGFGVNTDVDHTPFAVFDQDKTPESRTYVEAFSGTSDFSERAPITSAENLRRRMQTGELTLALDIPAGFGRDLRRGYPTDVGAWIDGAFPFLAQTTEGYLQGVQQSYLAELAATSGRKTTAAPLADIEPRFLYNQSFDSIQSLVPSAMAMLLALIPAILMALAVVREKEFGSITNLYVTPVTRLEFILGKQLPYVALSMISFVVLTLMAIFLFGVPMKGSVLALIAGTTIYVFATTAYGLLISSFTNTQVAAMFGTAIMTVIPAAQFAGMLSPVSSLTGAGAVIGKLFPMSYYIPIVFGVFDKSLGFSALVSTSSILALFIPGLWCLTLLFLRKQER